MYAVAPTEKAKNIGALAHLGSYASLVVPFAGIVVAVALLALNPHDDWVRAQCIESLNFQLTAVVANLCVMLLCIVLIGFPLAIALWALILILPAQAAVAAVRGETYTYPAILRFIPN